MHVSHDIKIIPKILSIKLHSSSCHMHEINKIIYQKTISNKKEQNKY